MVDHLTTVLLDARAPRTPAIADVLAALGFAVHRRGGRVVAESAEVEAQDARRRLAALGFRDREFSIVLEYVRRRGIL
jgi:hypothetical protein